MDDSKEKEGTMGYLRSVNRFLVAAARGWNTFDVTAGEGVIGRRLFDELQTAGDLGRVNVRLAGFPCPMTNRIAYGAAAFAWGKRPKESINKVPHRLLAQDFFEATREEFESAPILHGTTLESRREFDLDEKTRVDFRRAEWYQRAKAQVDYFCLLYGKEHRASRMAALDKLIKMHKDKPHMYPMHWVQDT